MTRTTIALLASAAMVMASVVTVSAQGKKGSAPKTPHVTAPKTTKVSSVKPTTAKTSGPKKTTTSLVSKGPKAPKAATASTKTVKVTKTTTKGTSAKSTKAGAKSTTKLAKADAKKTAKTVKPDSKTAKSETTSTTTTTTTTTSGDDGTPVTLTKVQEKLQKNTKLAEKLEGRLPAGTDLMDAAEGFRNLGQFVAAVNVSNNLGLDFDKLKTAMVDDGRSLGQAIQYVKADVESPIIVAQRAETDAELLIRQTETTITTTTTTTTSTTSTKTKSKDKPKRTLRTQSAS